MGQAAQFIETILTAIGIIVVFVLAGEFLPDLKRYVRQIKYQRQRKNMDHRTKADTFSNVDWANEYFFEYWSALGNVSWASYVMARCLPYSGKYINIGPGGVRKTWKPETVAGDDVLEVFFFGGSVGWGMGARDDHTIPSELAKLYERKQGTKARITNYSENSFVSTQSLIGLMLALRSGKIPDVVIFLDGVNDAFSASQQGVAGLPQNDHLRAAELNVLHVQMRWRSIKAFIPIVFKRTLRLINGIVGMVNGKTTLSQQTAEVDKDEQADLADDVVHTYADIMSTVRLLGEKWSFTSYFFWQPTIYSKKHLTSFEASEKEINQKYENFFQDVNIRVEQNDAFTPENRFYDLLHLLDDFDEGVFLDFAHVSEQGNKVIAERIFASIESNSEQSRLQSDVSQ
jgi:lysophospholipase L1-like esterase